MNVSHALSFSVLNSIQAALIASGGLLAAVGSASSQESQPWTVQGGLLGETKKNGGFKDSKDVSGLACNEAADFPKLCIIVDDEAQGAQVVILKEGELRAGDFIPLISDTFQNDPLELDAEGASYADGVFYVIGSHGRPRREEGKSEEKNVARGEATRRVFRIVLAPEAVDMATGKIKSAPKITESSALGRMISAEPKMTEWFDKALKDNGLTVEGIAVQDGKLYVGMRAPVLDGEKAVILEVPIAVVFDEQKGAARLYEMVLEKDAQGNVRGVRDLVPHMGRFLILAGPVHDPEDDSYEIGAGDYTVYSWTGSDAKLDGKFDLKGYGRKVKPEAILPLEASTQSFLALVLFDGPVDGKPTPVIVELK